MTIADSCKPLNFKKGSILNAASFLDFQVSKISNANPIYK